MQSKHRKLSPKEKIFVDEYLKHLNATQAVKSAGYKVKHPREKGSQLLAKGNIKSYLADKMAKREKRTEITQDLVLSEIAKIAFANIGDVMEWNQFGVTLKDSKSLSRDQKAVISSIKERKQEGEGFSTTSLEVKFHDKIKALELAAKHLGLLDGSGKPKDTENRFTHTDAILSIVEGIAAKAG